MSKNVFILEASPREDVGKGASRRLRRLDEQIPAIIYGAGEAPTPVTIPHNDIAHAIENEAFFSHIITIKIGDKEESVVIKDLQRHPAKPLVLHADFMRIRADQKITVNVPLHFLDEDKCIGVRQEGGIVNHMINNLEISCLPKDLPEYIEVFMAELHVGDVIHISDLALPEGVTSVELEHGEDHTVAQVVIPKIVEEPEPEPEEALEGEELEGEGEEGEAAEGEASGEEGGGEDKDDGGESQD